MDKPEKERVFSSLCVSLLAVDWLNCFRDLWLCFFHHFFQIVSFSDLPGFTGWQKLWSFKVLLALNFETDKLTPVTFIAGKKSTGKKTTDNKTSAAQTLLARFKSRSSVAMNSGVEGSSSPLDSLRTTWRWQVWISRRFLSNQEATVGTCRQNDSARLTHFVLLNPWNSDVPCCRRSGAHARWSGWWFGTPLWDSRLEFWVSRSQNFLFSHGFRARILFDNILAFLDKKGAQLVLNHKLEMMSYPGMLLLPKSMGVASIWRAMPFALRWTRPWIRQLLQSMRSQSSGQCFPAIDFPCFIYTLFVFWLLLDSSRSDDVVRQCLVVYVCEHKYRCLQRWPSAPCPFKGFPLPSVCLCCWRGIPWTERFWDRWVSWRLWPCSLSRGVDFDASTGASFRDGYFGVLRQIQFSRKWKNGSKIAWTLFPNNSFHFYHQSSVGFCCIFLVFHSAPWLCV